MRYKSFHTIAFLLVIVLLSASAFGELLSLDVNSQLTIGYGDVLTGLLNPVQVVGAADNNDLNMNLIDPVDDNGRLTRFYCRFTPNQSRINGITFNLRGSAGGNGSSAGFVGTEVVTNSVESTQVYFDGGSFNVPLDVVQWYAMLPQDEYNNATPYNDLAFGLKFTDTDGNGDRSTGDVMEIVGIVYSTGSDSVYGMTAGDLTAIAMGLYNIEPEVDAGEDISTVLPDLDVVLAGEVSDDGLPLVPGMLSVSWSKVSGPGTVVFDDVTDPETEVTFGGAGEYVLRLTANDWEYSVYDDVTVWVNTHHRPVVEMDDFEIELLEHGGIASIDIDATVSDDGMPEPASISHTWSVVSKPDGAIAAFSPSANVEDVTAAMTKVGVYVLRLSASDGELVGSADITVRVLAAAPPVGVHPRVLFGPAEVPAIRERIATQTVASQAYANVVGYADAVFNASPGSTFYRLKNGDDSVDLSGLIGVPYDLFVVNYGRGNYEIYGPIMAAAFVAMVEDDSAKGIQAATAAATAAKAHATYYTQQGNSLNHDANSDLALAYDFSHQWMTETQRGYVRNLIDKMTVNRRVYGVGMFAPDISTNWRTHHDHLAICSLAIEGEAGYHASVYNDNIAKLQTFTRQWGIYDTGFGHEGYGYTCFGMHWGLPSLLAAQIRGQNLLDPDDSNFYKFINNGLYEMAPWGGVIFAHHDTVDPLGGVYGWGYDVVYALTKFIYPTDKAVDYVYRHWDQHETDTKKHMMTAMFGMDPLTEVTEAVDAGRPVTAFTRYRGLVNTRTDWSHDAIRLDFECRGDMWYLGHCHSDRNGFTMQALSRPWIIDPYKNYSANKDHSTVLIDGIGQSQSYSSGEVYWPSAPGKFVEFEDNENYTLGAGDAKVGYGYFRRIEQPGETYIDTPFTWSEFVYNPDNEVLDGWMYTTKLDWQTADGTIGIGNPVLKAFRTAALIRGERPYVLIIDDIQKDAGTHTYEWSVSTDDDVVADSLSATDAVLRHAADGGAGDPRLLVRAVEAKGTASTITLGDDFGNYRKLKIKRSNVVAPDYKVILFPHHEGDALPVTSWNGDKLTVSIDGQVDVFEFSVDGEGRTRFTLMRDGCLTMPTNGDVTGDFVVDMGDIAEVSTGWDDCYGLGDLAKVTANWLVDEDPQKPYSGSNIVLPGVVEAEDYDLGGEGVAYHDTTAGNAVGLYRDDDVDIANQDGGYNIGWADDGEWLEYSVDVAGGVYDMQARVASIYSGKQLRVKLGDATLGTFDVPNTGDWGVFQTVTLSGINLPGGNDQVLRLEIVGGDFNLNWVRFQ